MFKTLDGLGFGALSGMKLINRIIQQNPSIVATIGE